MVRRTLALVLVLFALTAAPASAGGPTSVVLSAPPRVAAFGYDDAQYAELQQLTVGVPGQPSDDRVAGRFVRATWLLHDMSVWRIDIIYPDAPGGPWILTAEDRTGPVTPRWHRSSNPAQLIKLLGELKLLSGEFYGGPTLDDGFLFEHPTPEPQPAPAPPPQTQATTSSVFTGWRWIIPGVLLGAAASALAVRLFPKRRWELIG